MSLIERNFVLFQTDLFVWRQRDEDLDHWSVGADCAGWFYARLVYAEGIDPSLEPVMEDWGWIFAVEAAGVKIWTNVWAYFEIENTWLFGIEPAKPLLRRPTPKNRQRAKDAVCDVLDQTLVHDSRIAKHRWYSENPFELLIKSL